MSSTTVNLTSSLSNLILTGTPTQPSCGVSNGSVSLLASNGISPYVYSKDGINYVSSNVFSGLIAGSYTFYVKDANGCVSSTSVSLTSTSSNLVLTGTPTQPSCGVSNGSVSLSASNGSSPYVYSKDGINYGSSNVFSGLSAGSYTFYVKDANGCVSSTTVNLTSSLSNLVLTGTPTQPSCGVSNGSVSLSASNGSSPYVYSRDGINYGSSNVFSGLSAGSYTFYVKDANGCVSSTTVNLTSSSSNLVLTGTPTQPSCGVSNGSVSLSASNGSSPYVYSRDGINYVSSNVFSGLSAGSYTFYVKDANGCVSSTIVNLTSSLSNLVLTGTPTQPSCGVSNGSVSLSASNGSSPYVYSRDGINYGSSNVFNGLSAGSYTFYVKDANGCVSSTTVNLTSSLSNLVLTGTPTQPSCGVSNGSVSLSASNGSSPYVYSKDGINYGSSNVFNGLSAGSYTFYVKDANGCVSSTTVNLTSSPSNLSLVSTPTQPTCGGTNGSVSLSASNGSSPYVYSKDGINYGSSNVFSGLSAGSYTFYVKDANGCVSSTTVNLTSSSSNLVLTGTPTQPSCGVSNGSVSLSASNGSSPYVYSKDGINYGSSNVFNGLSAGSYTFYVKDANGCVSSTTVNLTSSPSNLSLVSTPTQPTCGGTNGSVSLSASNGISPYVYSRDGINYVSSNVFSGLSAGSYTFYVKDANGCVSSTTVNLTSSLSNLILTGTPTQPSCGVSNGSVSLLASNGSSPYVYSKDGINYVSSNVFSGLIAGSYTFYVKDANGCVSSTTVNLTSSPSNLVLTGTPTQPSCGVSNGSVSLSASNGSSPYVYSRDGINYGSSNVFSGLSAGSYTFYVKDANGCVSSTTVNLTSSSSNLVLTGTPTQPSCGVSNGSVSLSASNGSSPYVYSRDGINYGSSNVFSGLSAGSYTFYVKEVNGCVSSTSVSLTSTSSNLVLTGTPTQPSCGVSNGSVSLSASNGISPYVYSRDGINYVSSNVFSGLSAGSYTFSVKDANGCVSSTTVNLTSSSSNLVLTGTPTQPSCGVSNGSVSLSASNGSSPYVYSRDGINYGSSNVFSGLSAGSYTFYVKDANGCVSSTTVNLTSSSSNLVLTGTPTQPSCGVSNGSVSLSASNGSSPYVYSKDGINYVSSNVFSGLSAGSYTFYVKDANGCVSSTTVNLTSSLSNLVLTGTPTQPSCGVSNGSVSLSASNGSSPYVYSRDGINYVSSNVFSGLSAGSYTFYVKEVNGCVSSTTVNLTSSSSNLVLTGTPTQPSCGVSNGSVSLSASNGSSPYVYSKDGINYVSSNVFSGLSAGSYTFYVKDANGCVSSTTVNLTSSLSNLVLTGTPTQPSCGVSNGSVSLSASNGSSPYVYSKDGINYGSSNVFSGLSAGSYTFYVKDANGCVSSTTVNLTSSPSNLSLVSTPTQPTCGGTNGSVSLSASNGSSPYVYSKDGINYGSSNVFSGLSAGSYTFYVKDANGCVSSTTVNLTSSPSNLSLVSTPTQPICGGTNGSVSLLASNGSSPYLYSRDGINYVSSNVFSGLSAGSYTFYVKDANGCVSSTTVNLTSSSSNLVLTGTPTQPSCGVSNGSVSLSASNGSSPYVYSKDGINYVSSNVFSGLSAGSYTFYVKEVNGCVSSTTVNLTSSSSNLVLTGTPTQTSCGVSNGSVSLLASNGSSPYVYSKDGINYVSSNVFSGLSAGSYTFYVKEVNGCVSSTTVNLTNKNTEPNAPVITSDKMNICGTEVATLTTINCTGTITWSTGSTQNTISVNVGGTYNATCMNACGISGVSNVIQISKGVSPNAPIVSSDKTNICGTEVAILTASNCTGVITWSTGSTQNTISVNVGGTYNATCMNACGISGVSNVIQISKGVA